MDYNLLDSSSMSHKYMVDFHNLALVLLMPVLIFVLYFLGTIMMNKLSERVTNDSEQLEIVWTLIPVWVLLLLGVPSLSLLYYLDDSSAGGPVHKAIGHQWYWTYENTSAAVDSYLITNQWPRNLSCDQAMLVNTGMSTLITTSADVIHCWTIPSLGVKVDAVPGRLNQAALNVLTPGTFWGQCSEICGTNHSFMPISLECTT